MSAHCAQCRDKVSQDVQHSRGACAAPVEELEGRTGFELPTPTIAPPGSLRTPSESMMGEAERHGSEDERGQSSFDLERMFCDIGRIVVLFQVLENQVWQLGVVALGLDDFDRSRRRLTGLAFKELCDRTGTAVFDRLDALGRPAHEYRRRVQGALDRCDDLRMQRNQTVHSAYVFLEGGGELRGVLRSDITRGPAPDALEFDQELLTDTSFTGMTAQLASAAFELSLCRVQLIHWL